MMSHANEINTQRMQIIIMFIKFQLKFCFNISVVTTGPMATAMLKGPMATAMLRGPMATAIYE